MTKISIIVPIYNAELYLKRCLDSLINQTISDIEILCINDGSTDNSKEIIQDFVKIDSRIKLFSFDKSGVSAARNKGIDIASGTFIGFVDADDYVDTDYFEKLYNAAEKHNCDIACSNIIRENKKKKKFFLNYKKYKIAKTIKDKYELIGLPEHCYVWNKIYRTEFLKNHNIRFIEGLVYEDIMFTPDAAENANAIVSVPNIYYHYWINNSSIVKTSNDNNRADKISAKKYLIDKCKKHNLSLDRKQTLLFKREIFLLGIKILKIYEYRATRVYSLFGVLPVLIENKYI